MDGERGWEWLVGWYVGGVTFKSQRYDAIYLHL